MTALLSRLLGLLDSIRRLPVTVTYTAVLVVVGSVLTASSMGVQDRVVEHVSTNLHNLLRGHIGTLIASAFVTSGPVWTTVPVLACALALVERRFGSLRTLGAFLAGHIGATLIVAVGLIVAVAAGWMSSDVLRAADVGVSYGGMALIGALLATLPRHWHRPWALGWLVVAVIGVILGRSFTNVGHFIALLIGIGVAVLLRNPQWAQAAMRTPLSRLDRGLLGITCALGLAFLLG